MQWLRLLVVCVPQHFLVQVTKKSILSNRVRYQGLSMCFPRHYMLSAILSGFVDEEVWFQWSCLVSVIVSGFSDLVWFQWPLPPFLGIIWFQWPCLQEARSISIGPFWFWCPFLVVYALSSCGNILWYWWTFCVPETFLFVLVVTLFCLCVITMPVLDNLFLFLWHWQLSIIFSYVRFLILIN